jgi:hypothetical protein
MVETSLSGSGEGPGAIQRPGLLDTSFHLQAGARSMRGTEGLARDH